MLRNLFAASLFAVGTALASLPASAAEPSLHEVYQAAASGRLEQAQGMMQEVLRVHPNSGKAHFVEAELLAKQGLFQKAGEELAAAEKLAPGLPFAKPQAVENLKSLLRSGHSTASTGVSPLTAAPAGTVSAAAAPDRSLPWAWLLGGLGLIAFIAWAARLMGSRSSPLAPATAGGNGNSHGSGGQAWGGGYAGPAPAAPAGGFGSRVMGGLATGAAIGAGVMAGEAIARHFMQDDDEAPRRNLQSDTATGSSSYFNDMGGDDFGIAGASSWDDGGSGDNDWS